MRDEMLEYFGTLQGHEITGVFSLDAGDEFEAEDKIRHSPLAPFFRGTETKYSVSLRFDESVGWEVVHISLI